MAIIKRKFRTATIASGASVSGKVSLGYGDQGLCAIVMPGAWTAAGLTFQGSADDGATWNDIYDTGGTELAYTVAASRFIPVPKTALEGVPFIRIRSGTAGAPVNQGADRTLRLVFREL